MADENQPLDEATENVAPAEIVSDETHPESLETPQEEDKTPTVSPEDFFSQF
jgi:hypothetical protein